MTPRYQLSLSPQETESLSQLAKTGSAAESRRARIILLTAEGLAQIAIAAEIGLSERQVRRWQRAFQAERMGVFSQFKDPTSQTEPPVTAPPPEETPSPPAETVSPGTDKPRRKLYMRKKSGIQPDDPMSEAGRKTLHFHFERMLLHEPGSRLGENIEAVHDMRVATRRMRSAFALFQPFYRRQIIHPLLADLRRTARRLGRVRDLDVFLEKLGQYQATLPPATADSTLPLVEVCRAQREEARSRLIAHLDGAAFERFVADFEAFLTTPGMGARKIKTPAPVAYQVRHVAPRLIYTRYEAVRAYETVLDHASIETLHALRIECKLLRYTLEFFSEVLGKEVDNVIEELKRLQDHLGDLNDAEVAGIYLREFVSDYEKNQIGIPLSERRSIEQVVQYMAYQFAEKHHLTTTFTEAWVRFNQKSVRRDLGLAVAAL